MRSNAEEGEQLSQGIKVSFGCVAQTVTNHRTSEIGIPELSGSAILQSELLAQIDDLSRVMSKVSGAGEKHIKAVACLFHSFCRVRR